MNKQTLTEKILIFDRGTIELVESGDLVGSKVIPVEDVKEAVKKRNLELKKIELNLMNNEAEDWDIALSRVRNLINDKDKIFGRKLI